MDEQNSRSYPGRENYSSQKDKIKPSPSWLSGKRLLPIFIGITTILLVVVIVLGAVIVHLLTTLPPTQVSTTTVPSPSATPSSTVTPSSTTTQQTISKNLTIPCVDCSGSGPITLELNKIVINVSQNKTLFYFIITNISSSDVQEDFAKIQLQNSEDASITSGDGQGDMGAGWELGPGNSIIHITTFPFIPKNGVKYTLILQTDYQGSYTFQNEPLTF